MRDRRAGAQLVGRLPELGHVFDRHDHLDLHGLSMAGVHDRHRPGAIVGPTSQEPGDLLQRPLRGRQADPLR